jgi:uncharacterized protein
MKIAGTTLLSAPPDRVFEALHDPSVLVATIPGVQSLEQVESNRYRMIIVAGVASIKGAYDGEVTLADQQAPSSFVLRAKGAGAPGTVDATVRVTLAEEGAGTRLTYEADADVGGMVGGVGQRMLTGVSKKMAGEFFGKVDAVLTGGLAAAGTAAGPESEVRMAQQPTTFSAPAPAGQSTMEYMRVPFWVVLAGVGAGAFWALAGVLVGWAVTRRPR